MKKYLALFLAFIGLVATSNGQKLNTFSDDFESYKNNAWLAQNSSIWDTWSGTPSTTGDDVRVTNSDAYSGSKSIYFSAGPGPEDVVLPFGGLHSRGQLFYSAMMKIPTKKTAYFNFQGAASVGTTWAVEVTFKSDATVEFSNLGTGVMFQKTYPQGVWFEIRMYVNLTKNEWHVYIDDNYMGSFSNSVNRASYLDIYPLDTASSFWVDDVSFVHAPPVPNNAGVELLTSPSSAVCGKNDIKVRVVNNGINKLDSVRVYWSLDGVVQSPVYVKTAIDTILSTTGNRLEVTLDSVLNLSKGKHSIKVWTAFPNGAADTLNLDDTLEVTLNAEVRGVSIDYDKPFQGNKGLGTAAWPDTVCAGDTITYGVTPPTGYTNADLGTEWEIKSVNIKSNGVAPKDTQTIKAGSSTNFRLRYMADTSEANSIFKVEISVSVGKGGCDSVLTRYFFVEQLPNTGFTANSPCIGVPVSFTNTSKGPGITKYNWDFGNNTTSTQKSPLKFYNTPGMYNVTLRATAASGCRSTVSQTIIVNAIPEPKFSAINVCDGDSMYFNDSSTISFGKIASYYWDFGDGDTSISQNPSHLYQNTGTFRVRLTLSSDSGCTKRFNKDIEVYSVPAADFSTMNVCEFDSVTFTNASTYVGTDAVTYQWDLGDGNLNTAEHLNHLYGAPGNYSVKLTATTANGCTDSSLTSVEVYPLPVADFSAPNTCLGQPTVLTNNSSVGSGSIIDYKWNLRGQGIVTTKDAENTYPEARVYKVDLWITSTGGCRDSITKSTEVYPVPVAEFEVENVCLGTIVTYDNKSTTTSDSLKYQWFFGDGNVSVMESPANTYTADGTYDVKLLVNTEDGCTDSTEQSVEIYPLPDAGFTFEHKGWGQYDFTPDDADLTSYRWRFGDGGNSEDVSPYHEYATEGDFEVTLTTTDDNGCTAEKTITVPVSTGISEKSQVASPFKVFPNPFSDEVNIAYELKHGGNVTIDVYGLDGKRLVSLVNQKQSVGKYQYQFATPDASGIYMVRMVVDGSVYHERIVKAQ